MSLVTLIMGLLIVEVGVPLNHVLADSRTSIEFRWAKDKDRLDASLCGVIWLGTKYVEVGAVCVNDDCQSSFVAVDSFLQPYVLPAGKYGQKWMNSWAIANDREARNNYLLIDRQSHRGDSNPAVNGVSRSHICNFETNPDALKSPATVAYWLLTDSLDTDVRSLRENLGVSGGVGAQLGSFSGRPSYSKCLRSFCGLPSAGGFGLVNQVSGPNDQLPRGEPQSGREDDKPPVRVGPPVVSRLGGLLLLAALASYVLDSRRHGLFGRARDWGSTVS